MKRSGSVCLCALLLASVFFIMPASASYPMFHYDEQRTGNFTDAGPTTADLVYKISLSGFIDGSPVISDKKVYVINGPGMSGNWNPGLYCIDANNGSILWRIPEIYGMSTPAVGNGYVFIKAFSEDNPFGSGAGKLYSVNATTGSVRWNRTIENNVHYWDISSSPLIYNGKVYITASSTSSLYAFYFNGTKAWDVPAGNEIGSFSSPSAYNGLIFFAGNQSGENRLYCVDEKGAVQWNISVDSTITNTPSVGYGNIYFATGSKFYAVNLSTHQEIWNASIGTSMSTAALAYGKVFIGSNNRLYCFDVNGNEIWNYSANGPIQSSPAIGNGIVYFATNTGNGTIYALNVTDKSLVWKYTLSPPQYIMSSPYISNGKLYIGADDGNLYIFGLWKGDVTLHPGTFNITADNGKIYEVKKLTALGALEAASKVGGFSYSVNDSFGDGNLYPTSIDGINKTGWWCYCVNGVPPMNGTNKYPVGDGDVVTYYYWTKPSDTYNTAPYIVSIKVNMLSVNITSLSVSNATRGGNATAWVNVSSFEDNWYVIVVSGVNENGEAIAGISTLRLAASESLRLPAIIPIPQQVQTGNYELYAGVYMLDDYPSNILHWYGYDVCKVS
ncbi:MAG: PQQ-binding-like beta-propeller repeat protein [Methanophagales archaeon]|nr:PQQ-binding-like beta-propeller repeat protein [Methanophagales archaeon]